jgi:hypothetical protein
MKAFVLDWAVGIVLVLSTATLVASAPQGDEVAAVFPPWWRQGAALTAAASAGQVLAAGGVGFVFVVRAPLASDRANLRRAGAFLLLNAQGLTGCAKKLGT